MHLHCGTGSTGNARTISVLTSGGGGSARCWLHSLGIKYQRINEKTGLADGHERLDVKAKWHHFMKTMHELDFSIPLPHDNREVDYVKKGI